MTAGSASLQRQLASWQALTSVQNQSLPPANCVPLPAALSTATSLLSVVCTLGAARAWTDGGGACRPGRRAARCILLLLSPPFLSKFLRMVCLQGRERWHYDATLPDSSKSPQNHALSHKVPASSSLRRAHIDTASLSSGCGAGWLCKALSSPSGKSSCPSSPALTAFTGGSNEDTASTASVMVRNTQLRGDMGQRARDVGYLKKNSPRQGQVGRDKQKRTLAVPQTGS